MHFTTATFLFGMVGAAVAAPQPEANAAYGAMEMAGGFFPGAPNSACYCCPAAGSGSNCGRVNEDGRCQNADVLICCDAREQACSNLATLAVPNGNTGLLHLGGLLTKVVDGLL